MDLPAERVIAAIRPFGGVPFPASNIVIHVAKSHRNERAY